MQDIQTSPDGRRIDPNLFVHVADLHLAPRSSSIAKRDPATNRLIRDLDMDSAFERSVDQALASDPLPCAYVIAGDVFDTYKGSPDAFRTCIKQFRRLTEVGIHVLAIAGNHDTPTNLLKTPMYAMLAEVYGGIPDKPVATPDDEAVYNDNDDDVTPDDVVLPVSLAVEATRSRGDDSLVDLSYSDIRHVRAGDIEFVLLPHIRCLNGDIEASDMVPTTDAPHRVLVVHGVACGDPTLQQMDEQREVPIAKWILDMDWDYVAFGHYHKPGWIPGYKGKAAYSGSLENTVISGPDVCMERGPVFVDTVKSGVDLYDQRLQRVRGIVNLPTIDVTGMSVAPDRLDDMISDTIKGGDIDGAICRLTVKGVTKSLYKSLPRRSFNEIAPTALVMKVEFEFAVEAEDDFIPAPQDDQSAAEDGATDDDAFISSSEFLPLDAEMNRAVDAMILKGDVAEGLRDEVIDILHGYLA